MSKGKVSGWVGGRRSKSVGECAAALLLLYDSGGMGGWAGGWRRRTVHGSGMVGLLSE